MIKSICFALAALLLAADFSNAQPESTGETTAVVAKLNPGSTLPKIAPLVKYSYTAPGFNTSDVTANPASYISYTYTVYFPSGYSYAGLWRAGINAGSESVYATVKSQGYSSSSGVYLTEYLTPYSIGFSYQTVNRFNVIYFYSYSLYIYSSYYILIGYAYYY